MSRSLRRLMVGIVVSLLAATAVRAQFPRLQPRPPAPQFGACLHERGETGLERERRMEALRAARLITAAVASARGGTSRRPGSPLEGPYPGWAEVAAAGAMMGRMDGGSQAQLARKMRWSSDEPLPGWLLHYVADSEGYAFSLADDRDRCGLTYSSNDRGSILEAYPVEGRPGIVPVDSQ